MAKPWEMNWDTPVQPTVTPLPESPQQRRDRELKEQAAAQSAAQLGISMQGENRAQNRDVRDVEQTGFGNAQALRKEFNSLPQVQDYQTVIRQYGSALKTNADPTGDQALITAYAKMLDPGSVVREQEFNTVANADSSLGKVYARISKELGYDGGGLLRPEIRQRVRDEMQNLTKSYNQSYELARNQYGELASSSGIEPEQVVGPHLGEPFREQIQQARQAQKQELLQSEQNSSDFGSDENGLTGRVTDESPNTQTNEGPNVQDSYLGQGISGVNEGIANLVGAPVDMMTAIMNTAPRAINAAANTNMGSITKPVLGSEWLKDKMGGWSIYDQTNDPSKQFTRRVGESVGSALAPSGMAGSIPRAATGLLAGLGGGVGAATAQQAFPGNPIAEMGGELLGGGIAGGGLFNVAKNQARRKIEEAVPTVDQLKAQAGELYRSAESRGVTADPMMTQQLSDNMRTTLRNDGRISPTGRISEVYPKAKEAMQLTDDYAGKPMNPTQMQTVRKVITDGLSSQDANERRIASQLTDNFDEWANPLAPEFPKARDVASRYLNAQKLEEAKELAGSRAGQFSGSGFENALRTEYRGLDRNAIKGKERYGADLRDQIEQVSRGTPMSNIARGAGKLAPTGVVPLALGPGAAAAAGGALGGPVGAGIAGLGASALGIGGRVAATKMTTRAADLAELIARNGGKLPEAEVLDTATKRHIARLLATQMSNYLTDDEQ